MWYINLLFSILSTLNVTTRLKLRQDFIYWIFAKFSVRGQTRGKSGKLEKTQKKVWKNADPHQKFRSRVALRTRTICPHLIPLKFFAARVDK